VLEWSEERGDGEPRRDAYTSKEGEGERSGREGVEDKGVRFSSSAKATSEIPSIGSKTPLSGSETATKGRALAEESPTSCECNRTRPKVDRAVKVRKQSSVASATSALISSMWDLCQRFACARVIGMLVSKRGGTKVGSSLKEKHSYRVRRGFHGEQGLFHHLTEWAR
jgi:hypothetical protein